jgi:hypothetical protein
MTTADGAADSRRRSDVLAGQQHLLNEKFYERKTRRCLAPDTQSAIRTPTLSGERLESTVVASTTTTSSRRRKVPRAGGFQVARRRKSNLPLPNTEETL